MMKPIGKVRSPFKEKFGIPRQPHLAQKIKATVEIPTSICSPEHFELLEGFNFIWLIGQFHQAHSKSSKVRPPRLGGNKKIGVFATRSPFRPNPLSLSLVQLDSIIHDDHHKKMILNISGIDLVDETPIYDIKPYISDHDSPWTTPLSGWIEDSQIMKLEVTWSNHAKAQAEQLNLGHKHKENIEITLQLDPRPAFHEDNKTYHLLTDTFDTEFTVKNDQVIILKIKNSTD